MHVFVDESERRGYLLVAAVVAPPELHGTRTLLRGLLLPGERRVHFKSERDSRRRLILARLVEAGVRTRLYAAGGAGEPVRAVLLRHLVTDAIALGAQRLVIDARDPAGNARDRSVIAKTKARAAGLVYEHMPASGEPLTWIADAVAWSYGAGGDWRRRVEPLVETVTDLGALR
ncbi:hypothetical protein GCM10012275_60600 [Longimycelium tulufanense]|uniref:DUF3800 domain-containing protein n=1 Tax=Longimycelium tulufanense TaxID=907463 RepID=A0A8J3CIE3_9PSEU|nr:hypothetical protein [Longimycelium tulufanense]GGM81884.1 hypothetical protein GCM10012275_60600 [Longimycelium tulufanense]